MSGSESGEGFADVSYGGAALSPLAPDMEAQGDYIEVNDNVSVDSSDEEVTEERIVQDDGSIVIRVTKKKKVKKAAKKVTKNLNELADATVKLVAVGIDNLNDTTNELPAGIIKTGEWDARLLSCFDHCVPNCFMATCCPCVSAAQIASRVGYSYWNVLTAYAAIVGLEYIFWIVAMATLRSTDYESGYIYDATWGGYVSYTYSVSANRFPVWGYISTVCAVLVFIAFWQLRTVVRQKFTIPGSAVEDFLISCFCSCCSLAQMATHVKSYKPNSCDFGPPDELRAYVN